MTWLFIIYTSELCLLVGFAEEHNRILEGFVLFLSSSVNYRVSSHKINLTK